MLPNPDAPKPVEVAGADDPKKPPDEAGAPNVLVADEPKAGVVFAVDPKPPVLLANPPAVELPKPPGAEVGFDPNAPPKPPGAGAGAEPNIEEPPKPLGAGACEPNKDPPGEGEGAPKRVDEGAPKPPEAGAPVENK